MHLNESKIKPRIVCSIVASMVMATVWGQSLALRPKLVVGVVIEGLSADQLQLLRGQMGQKGFNRLINDGVVIDRVDYGAPLDQSAAVAMLYTGAAPRVNGIDRATVYDNTRRRNVSAYQTDNWRGILTDQSLSPEALLVSNLADEVRIHSDGVGTAYSIALDPQMALAMAGHAANSAVWFNDVNGSWASSTYYTELPAPAQRANHYRPIASRLDTMAWQPCQSLDGYSDLPEHRRKYPFRVTFPAKSPDRYKTFAASPLANNEVTSLAAEYLTQLHLGQDDEPDMLSLSYSLSPYPSGIDGDTRVLRNDAYIRLDQNLAALFEAIERGPGMDRTVVFVAGTPATPRTRRDDERWRIPYGEFSARRAQTLLNSFLMAKYGNGEWVNSLDNGLIHINRRLAEQRGVELSEIRREAADFIAKMSGVTSATPLENIIAGVNNSSVNPDFVALQHSADVYFTVAPGWSITETEGNKHKLVERLVSTTAPCYILAPGVDPQRIVEPVDARAIAPTVARQLRIRSPNGAATPPISLK